MLDDKRNIDKNQIFNNFRKAKYILSISNFVVGIIFIITYNYNHLFFILVFAIVLLILSVVVFFYFSHLEAKLKKKISEK